MPAGRHQLPFLCRAHGAIRGHPQFGHDPEQAGQTFRLLYSHPDCLINEHDFQWAYLEADGQVAPIASKKIAPLVQIQAA
jgi:hypothetical protein